jgi:hypothetical protein
VLDHVPPGVVLVSVRALPTQILGIETGVIAAGLAFTYINAVVKQPPIRYVIKVPPTEMPDAKPVVESIVATLALELVHLPPVKVLLSTMLVPLQMLIGVAGAIGAGPILTSCVKGLTIEPVVRPQADDPPVQSMTQKK